MANLVQNGEQTFLDINGDPLSGGKVYFYVPNTGTPANTWSDPGLTTVNTNPVILDQAGRAVIWGNIQYREVVQDQFGNTQWDRVTSGLASEIDGALTVNGNSTLNGTLTVNGDETVNGNFTATGNGVIDGSLHVNNGVLVANGLTADNIRVTNGLEVDHDFSVGGVATIPTLEGNVNITGGLNVNGGNLGIAIGHSLFVDDIVPQSDQQWVGFTSGIGVDKSSTGWTGQFFGPMTVEDPTTTDTGLFIDGYDAVGISMESHRDGTSFGMYTSLGQLAWGLTTGIHPTGANIMTLSTAGDLVAIGPLGMSAHIFNTISTHHGSAELDEECLPYVTSIPVKTEPHVGMAPEDLADVPGAVTEIPAPPGTPAGRSTVLGVNYAAVTSCLWKAVQEQNALVVQLQQDLAATQQRLEDLNAKQPPTQALPPPTVTG